MFLPEVESRTQGSRLRTQKNPRPRTDFLRADPVEAKDTTRKCSPKKKEVFTQNIANFSRNSGVLQRQTKGFHKLPARSLACSKTKKKRGHDLDLFSTNQKIVLSSAEDRTFSRTCWLQGQRLDIRGQGLQNVSTRTPPLVFTLLVFMPCFNSINVYQNRPKISPQPSVTAPSFQISGYVLDY